MKLFWYGVAALCGLTSLPGCTKPLIRQDRVDVQREFGSTSVTVLSVIPWDNIRSKMSPKFVGSAGADTFTGSAALSEIAPLTFASVDRLARNSGLGAQLDGPTIGGTRTETTSAQGETSVTGTVTQTPGSPTVPSSPAAPKASASELNEAALKNVLDLIYTDKGARLHIDPFLKYLAATALVQEVNLLNEYVAQPAFTAQEYVPYVLRLQVANLPKRRVMPYDTYCTIAAFPSLDDSTDPSFGSIQTASGSGWISAMSTMVDVDPNINLRLLPLIATDSIDSAIRAAAESSNDAVYASAKASIGQIGVGGKAEQAIERARTMAARSVNSSLAIGGVADNTVRIRLGAQVLGSEEFAAAPRTHYATFLVLVPSSLFKQYQSTSSGRLMISLFTRIEQVDSLTGAVLEATDWESRGAELRDRVQESLGASARALPEASYRELVDAAMNNDTRSFGQIVDSVQDRDLGRVQGMLWLEAVDVARGLPYCVTRVPLSLSSGEPELSSELSVDAFEETTDGEPVLRCTIGGRHLTGNIEAALRVRRFGAVSLSPVNNVSITTIVQSNRVDFVFPKRELASFSLEQDRFSLDVTLRVSNVKAISRTYDVNIVPPPQQAPVPEPPQETPPAEPPAPQWSDAIKVASTATVEGSDRKIAQINVRLARSDLVKDSIEQLSLAIEKLVLVNNKAPDADDVTLESIGTFSKPNTRLGPVAISDIPDGVHAVSVSITEPNLRTFDLVFYHGRREVSRQTVELRWPAK